MPAAQKTSGKSNYRDIIFEVKDQVATRWREDQVASRLRAKADELVQKIRQGAKLSEDATSLGVKLEAANGFRREEQPNGLPVAVVAAVFRSAKDGAGEAPVAGGSQYVVFHVTDIIDPKVDTASEDVKKLKDSLTRSLSDEEVAEYVTKLQNDLGTSINQAGFAQVTGANQ